MKVLLGWLMAMLTTLPLLGGTPGSFRGTVVQGPEQADVLYIEGRNHSVRRVYVGAAKVRYDSEVPSTARQNPLPKVLPVGTQVRVTAEQDDGGEWRATDIEILKPDPQEQDNKKLAPPVTSQS